MRYLVLTDIHANLEALDACLAHALQHTFDQTLVLGDLVGYGGDPNAVVERIQSLKPVAIVRGNHDKVACGLEQAEGFNSVAKSAAKWTLEVLEPEHREWLCALPAGPIDVDDVVPDRAIGDELPHRRSGTGDRVGAEVDEGHRERGEVGAWRGRWEVGGPQSD